jgi:Protein of unknown function (DUF2738)
MSIVIPSNISEFDTSSIIFSPVKEEKSKFNPSIAGKRVQITTKYPANAIDYNNKRIPANSIGPLILTTEDLFSFGVSDKFSNDGGGLSVPICLWTKDNTTEYEKEFTETTENIIEKVIDHILSVRVELKKPKLERAELKSIGNVLSWKTDENTGERISGIGPVLYAKLISNKNGIMTPFYDCDGNKLEARSLIGQKFIAKFAIKFESIYFGSKIGLQVKLYEASDVRLLNSGPTRIIRTKPTPENVVQVCNTNNEMDDDNEQIVNSPPVYSEEPSTPQKRITRVKK